MGYWILEELITFASELAAGQFCVCLDETKFSTLATCLSE